MATSRNSSIDKLTSQFSQIYLNGKIDFTQAVDGNVAEQANKVLAKLEKLKASSNLFADVEISPYVKNIATSKNISFVEISA